MSFSWKSEKENLEIVLCTLLRSKKDVPGAQMVKNLPAMRETRVPSLVSEEPLEMGMTTHSSILAWRIPQIEEPGRLQSLGWRRVRQD